MLQLDVNCHPGQEGTMGGGQEAAGVTFCRQRPVRLNDVTLKIVLLNLATGEGAVVSTFTTLTPWADY